MANLQLVLVLHACRDDGIMGGKLGTKTSRTSLMALLIVDKPFLTSATPEVNCVLSPAA
jgi:hypothetical protein